MGGDRQIELKGVITSRSGGLKQMAVPVYSSGVVDMWRKGATWSEQKEKRSFEVKPEWWEVGGGNAEGAVTWVARCS